MLFQDVRSPNTRQFWYLWRAQAAAKHKDFTASRDILDAILGMYCDAGFSGLPPV